VAGLGFANSGNSSTLFTVQEGGNSVTLRMHFDVVGAVSPNSNVSGIQHDPSANPVLADSITVSFDLVSGGLDSLSISYFVARNVTTATKGAAGEGFSFSDGSGNTNIWYALDTVNRISTRAEQTM